MNLDFKKNPLMVGNFSFLMHKLKPFTSSSPSSKSAIYKLKDDYKEAMSKLNNVVFKDLNHGQKVTFISHQLTEDSHITFNQFLQDMETMNINKHAADMLETLLNSFPSKDHSKISDIFNTWHSSSLNTWDNMLERAILSQMDLKHQEKCNLEFGIYNFTENSISAADFKLLKNGKKMVVPLHMNLKEKEKRNNNELLNYAKRFRLYVERNNSPDLKSDKLMDWLEHAMATSINQDSFSFYNSLRNNYNNRHKTYAFLHPTYYPNIPITTTSKQNLTDQLNFKDALWNEADKGRGLSLLTINQMKEAEKKCISQLQGTPYPGSQVDLQLQILKEIDAFYTELDGQQRWLLSTMFGDLKDIPENCIVPFLNLKSKIHKMSPEDLRNKNFSKLTFRPVIDQSRWILNKSSKAFMHLIVSINEQLQSSYPLSSYKSILPKNGAEVSNHLRSFTFSKPSTYKCLISADLSDAYSNTMLNDLESALEFAANTLNLEAWKLELLISLSRLILNNNFIETSSGIFHLSNCLAMGNSSSGACLDLVGLTSEIQKLHPGSNSLPTPQPNMYFRYLDDTKAVLDNQKRDDNATIITNVGTMFPKCIPINIDMSHIAGGFLDIISIRKLATGKIETIMKKNFTSPPAFIPYISSHPNVHKLAALKSEMIRIRRTCSKPSFITTLDTMLNRELQTLGHISAPNDMFKFKEYIDNNFTKDFIRIDNKEDKDNPHDRVKPIVFGATTALEACSRTHFIVTGLLQESLKEDQASLATVVPSVKLKEILHSRRRYMHKLRN